MANDMLSYNTKHQVLRSGCRKVTGPCSNGHNFLVLSRVRKNELRGGPAPNKGPFYFALSGYERTRNEIGPYVNLDRLP